MWEEEEERKKVMTKIFCAKKKCQKVFYDQNKVILKKLWQWTFATFFFYKIIFLTILLASFFSSSETKWLAIQNFWNTWQVTHLGGWKLSQDFSSLALTEFEYFCHSMTVKYITFDKAYPIPYSQLHKSGLDIYIDATP